MNEQLIQAFSEDWIRWLILIVFSAIYAAIVADH